MIGPTALAKAVSVGSQVTNGSRTPQLAFGSGIALAGIIKGAKKIIAPISTVLTIFRMCLRIAAPCVPGRTNFLRVRLLCCLASLVATMRQGEHSSP